MKFSVKIVWGADEATEVTYVFETQAELAAFMRGVDEGCGWMVYEVVTND